MRAIKIHGTIKKIRQLVKLSKEALRDGDYRVAIRLHAVALNMEGKAATEREEGKCRIKTFYIKTLTL